jgi:asparagine synthase (glutamine-hydrolysing)
MPGIAGLVTRMPRQRAECELRQMLGILRHESFFALRTWVDEDLGLYVGWTALEGAFDDAGPLRNESGDVTLIFSGEDHPEPGIRARLKGAGHDLTEEEASYLAHVYEDDPSFPASLNGLFHGVVADRRKRCVTFFTDRYGMHRLYFHESGDTLYFAAEAKAILSARPQLQSVDARALGEWITLGCVLEGRSLFPGIHVMPGGSRWTCQNRQLVHRGTYFSAAEWEQQPPLPVAEFYQQFRRVFAEQLPRYFAGREPVAMSLTGGLDTRMIMAWQKSAPGTLPCYTWGGSYRDCQDVRVARKVAAVSAQPHHTITVGQEMLSRFPDYAARAVYLTDGCVDVSLAPDVYLNRLARDIAPARMTGLYGGEVLRHVKPPKPVTPMDGLFSAELSAEFARAAATHARATADGLLSFAVFKQLPWHHYGCLSLERSHVTMRTPFVDNNVVRTVFRAPASIFASTDISTQLIADGSDVLCRIPTDRGRGGRHRLIETVSHAFQEFLFKAEYAYDYGMPQWLAAVDYRIRSLHVERWLLGRHKAQHFRVWYRDQLADFVSQTLLDRRSLTRSHVNAKMVEHVVLSHIQGRRNYTTELHKLLGLELMLQTLVDRPPSEPRASSPILTSAV